MNAEPTFVPDPARALDLIEILIAGDDARLRSEADSAFDTNRLYDLDLSCLVLIHVAMNYNANVQHLYANSTETWRKVFDIAANGKNRVANRFNVNPSWLGEDVLGFMQNCVLPAIASGSPRIAVPEERGEGAGTPFDEVFIHVTASTFCAFSVLQGIAQTSPRFENLEALINELRIHLSNRDYSDGEVDVLTHEQIREEENADRSFPNLNNNDARRSRGERVLRS